jgi:hypothetical protein
MQFTKRLVYAAALLLLVLSGAIANASPAAGIVTFWSLLEKVENKAKTVPQRLKPDCKCGTYGTAEAVPLSEWASW